MFYTRHLLCISCSIHGSRSVHHDLYTNLILCRMHGFMNHVRLQIIYVNCANPICYAPFPANNSANMAAFCFKYMSYAINVSVLRTKNDANILGFCLPPAMIPLIIALAMIRPTLSTQDVSKCATASITGSLHLTTDSSTDTTMFI